jgi:hypothetical protein
LLFGWGFKFRLKSFAAGLFARSLHAGNDGKERIGQCCMFHKLGRFTIPLQAETGQYFICITPIAAGYGAGGDSPARRKRSAQHFNAGDAMSNAAGTSRMAETGPLQEELSQRAQ